MNTTPEQLAKQNGADIPTPQTPTICKSCGKDTHGMPFHTCSGKSQTPTPETDAIALTIAAGDWNKEQDCTQCALDHARKLELERDEARARVADLESNNRYQRGYDAGEKSMKAELTQLRKDIEEAKKQSPEYEVVQEIIQLRKVCDELAEKITFIQSQIGIGQVEKALTRILDSSIEALTTYSTLPHVKAKGTK